MGRRTGSKDAPDSGGTGKKEKGGRRGWRERRGIGWGKDPSGFVVLVSPASMLFCRS